MYNFNKQVENQSKASIPRMGIYRDGVRFVRMNPKNQGEDILFKILPAFDPAKAKMGDNGVMVQDPTSSVPFRDPQTGAINPWGRYIYVAPFTGHGKEGKGGNRRELISLKSFSDDPDVYDPLSVLISAINSDPIWKYLTEDRTDPDNDKVVLERKAINPKLTTKMLCNIVDIRRRNEGVFLAEFSSSVFNSLFSDKGLVMAQNLNVTDEMLAANPMARWYVGDLTDITEAGPVLRVLKDPESDRGRYAGFVIQIAFTAQRKPLRVRLEPDYLPFRYDLTNLDSIIKKPTEEEMVQTFVMLFNQWNPNRTYHEYELLKNTFGHSFKIPDPPARGMGIGFGASPALTQTKFENAASPEVPESDEQLPFINSAPQAGTQFQPRPAFQQPPAAQPIQPQASPWSPVIASDIPQQQVPQSQQHAPIPGDGVPKFDRNQFLADIKNRKK